MRRPLVTYHSRREKTIEVRVILSRRHEAVGSHEDRAVEGFKLLVLMPPRTSVVARKMLVFLEGGIVVSREHFAMGVYIDTRALSLLKKSLQVFQIVTADENSRVVAHTDTHFADLRMAVAGCIRFIKKRHSRDSGLACSHHEVDHFIRRQILGGRGESLHHEVLYLFVPVSQHSGVFRIGGDAL